LGTVLFYLEDRGGELKRLSLGALFLICLISATVIVFIGPAVSPVINQSTTLTSIPPGTSSGQVEYYRQTDLTFIITWTISTGELNSSRVDMLIFSNDTLFSTWVSNPSAEAASGLAYRHVPNLQVFGNFSTGSMSKGDPAQFPSSGGITNCDITFVNLGNTSTVNMKYSVTVEWDSIGRVIRPILLSALVVTAMFVIAGIVLIERKRSAHEGSLTKKNFIV
jgi:hypothetical protein